MRTCVSGWTTDGRSLMKHRKSRGPKMVPCGTPDLTSALVDRWPSTQTLCVRSLRKALIYREMFSSIPKSLSLLMRRVWGNLSKALEKSKTVTSVCDLTGSHFSNRSCMVSKSCVSHECFHRNPWLRGVRALWRQDEHGYVNTLYVQVACKEYKWG